MKLLRSILFNGREALLDANTKIYILFVFTILVACIFGLIESLFISEKIEIVLVLTAVLLVNLFLIIKVNKVGKTSSNLNLFLILFYCLALWINWFWSNGVRGHSPMFLIWMITLLGLLLESKKANLYFSLVLAITIVIIFFGYFNPGYVTDIAEPNDKLTRNFLAIFLAIFGVWMFAYFYKIENQKLHESIKELTQLEEEQNAKLAVLLTQKDQVFYTVTHDLKGPLNNASSVFDMLNEDDEEDDEERMIGLMADQLHKLNLFANGLIEWAKTSQHGIKLEKTKFNIAEKVNASLVFSEKLLAVKNIKLSSYVNEDIKAFGDVNLFDVVVRNLVSNAIKFSHDGSEIEINSQIEERGYIAISITDCGVGIEPQNLLNIFESGNSTAGTQNEKGTGFGLKLSKIYTELNGGEISVLSKVGVGSTFTFTIPKA